MFESFLFCHGGQNCKENLFFQFTIPVRGVIFSIKTEFLIQ